jgi:hypothetical protein
VPGSGPGWRECWRWIGSGEVGLVCHGRVGRGGWGGDVGMSLVVGGLGGWRKGRMESTARMAVAHSGFNPATRREVGLVCHGRAGRGVAGRVWWWWWDGERRRKGRGGARPGWPWHTRNSNRSSVRSCSVCHGRVGRGVVGLVWWWWDGERRRKGRGGARPGWPRHTRKPARPPVDLRGWAEPAATTAFACCGASCGLAVRIGAWDPGMVWFLRRSSLVLWQSSLTT